MTPSPADRPPLLLLPRTVRGRRALAALVVVLGIIFVIRVSKAEGDFDGFWKAGRHVLETGTLTDAKNVSRYLPTFQIFMLPFAVLPVTVAGAVWYLLNVLALLALPGVLQRLSGFTPRQQRPAWIIMIPFIYDNLILGQSGPMLLWACTWAVVAVREGRALRGGALIALATLVKIMPVVLLGVPLVMGRARAAVLGFLLAVGAGVLLSVATVGSDDLGDRTTGWAHRNRTEQTPWAMIATGRSLRYNNQGVGVVLARSLGDIGPAEARAAGSVRIAKLPLEVVWTLYGVIALVLAVAGLRALPAARRLGDRRAWLDVHALGCLAILLTSPLVWTHYFLWILPGLLSVAHRRRLLVVGGTIFVLGILFVPLRALGLHTWATVGLFLIITNDVRTRAAQQPVPAGASLGARADRQPSWAAAATTRPE